MQIDPHNETYGEIEDPLFPESEEQEKFESAVKEGKVVAYSSGIDQLKKLQDDLRKAGYKRLR